MADWLDKAIVALVLLSAIAYIARTYRKRTLSGAACKTGCGACEPTKSELVQIGRVKTR